MDTTRGGGGVIKFLQMSVPKRWLCAAGRRCTRGRGGNEKSRRQKREGKKKEKERKKRRRAGTPPRGGVVSVPALSILRHLLILLSPPPVGALVYRGYKQTRAGHTGEVTNAGHLHLAARVALSLPSLSLLPFFPSLFLLDVIFPRSTPSFFLFSLLVSLSLLSVFRPIAFLFSHLSVSLTRLFSFSAILARVAHGLVTRERVRVFTYVYARVYAGALCTVARYSPWLTQERRQAFPPLANFPLLNVNFSVIDGTRWAGFTSVFTLCPFPSIELHHVLERIGPTRSPSLNGRIDRTEKFVGSILPSGANSKKEPSFLSLFSPRNESDRFAVFSIDSFPYKIST